VPAGFLSILIHERVASQYYNTTIQIENVNPNEVTQIVFKGVSVMNFIIIFGAFGIKNVLG